MKKKWVLKQIDESAIPNLPEYPAFVLKLLALRNYFDVEAISDFLNPDYDKLYDPFIFKDMRKAVDRIWTAIEAREKIVIYADYDADAITACSVVYLALKKLGADVGYYIPDRFSEGYGVNLEAIKKIREEGATVVITVDCGINANEEADLAKILGIDFIITDHHELTGKLPEAFAIINPKNPNDQYPFQFLTGVGVVFKLVQALFQVSSSRLQGTEIPNGYEKWFLDLVAIGTVADCQTLTSENRILVAYGLKVLAKTRWPGLKALLGVSGTRHTNYDTFTLGFLLAPRINAAGRIKHADIAFKLLICEDPIEAQRLAAELNDLNLHRQMLTEQILSEARAQVELSDKMVLLASGLNWPKGVVGLVAGKLVEEYGRPVLVLDKGEEAATGSARSVSNFNMVEALSFAKDLLQKYGGHTQAAGFTLATNNIDAFYKRLLEYAEKHNHMNFDPILEADTEVSASDICYENYDYLEKFGPFGYGNPKLRFLARGFTIIDARTVGGQNQHLKLKLHLQDKVFDAIAFNQGFLAPALLGGKKIDSIFEIESNEWNGHKDLQLKICDIKINE